MRRLLLAAMCACLPALASAAEGGHGADPFLWYKIFNFAILAAGLGFLAVKFGGPALRRQQKSILKRLEEAQKKAAEAERHVKAVEEKMAGLDREIDALKKQAAEEMAMEVREMEAATQRMLEKVEEQAQYEIASAVEHAKKDLRAMAVDLAVQMAGERLAAEVRAGAQERLVERFVRSLGDGREGRN